MNAIIIMGGIYILIGIYQLSAPDFIWGQTVRSLRRRGILVAGRTPEWERKQRRTGILLVIMGVMCLAPGFFLFAMQPQVTPPSFAYSSDITFVTSTPGLVAPVVNSP